MTRIQSLDHVMSFNSWETAHCLCVDVGDSRDCRNIMVPLLDPLCFGGCSRGVPFVTGIELHGLEDVNTLESVRGCTTGDIGSDRLMDEYYELRFVLHGEGLMKYAGDVGNDVAIHPGDAVLCKHGTVSFRACGVSPVEDVDVPCRMSTFVVYIPKILLEERKNGDDDDDDVFGECTRFVQETLWPGEPCAYRMADVVSPDVLDTLLCGPKMVETSLPVSDVIPSDDEEGLEQYGGDGMQGFPALKKTLTDVSTYMLPNQTNRLALMFDPFANTPIPFVFGVEIFEPGHKTTPHMHTGAYEVFFILSGHGHGFCGNKRFPVGPGDIVAFHPGSTHGIDNDMKQRMYCIEVMLPDEDFAEFVRKGSIDSLGVDDLCILTRIGCS